MESIIIREILPKDNAQVAQIIRTVLMEFDAPKEGTAYADPQLDSMFETYQMPQSVYFVIEENGKVIGSAGIAPLQNGVKEVCELQKMYFLPIARGRGLGTQLMQKCLEYAKQNGFLKCYLETLPSMKAAQKLYIKSGFEYIDAPMGNTGHSSCPVWMLKEL